MKRTFGEKVFNVFNYLMLGLLAIACLFPFMHVIAKSLSSETAITQNLVVLWPVKYTTMAYKAAFLNSSLKSSFQFTVVLTLLGTFVNLIMSVLAAYPLSKRDLVGKKFFWTLILITMFIGGGLIPTYLLVQSLGLLNSIWALILPGAISTYNMIIIKTSFQGIPSSLEESARMDGCTDIGVLFRIILPLSKPILAAMALFYAVGHWNQFMAALIYMNDPKKYTLQLRLRQMIPTDITLLSMEGQNQAEIPNESLKASSIIIATVPILVAYPWLQKYFVKGVLIGSVKG